MPIQAVNTQHRPVVSTTRFVSLRRIGFLLVLIGTVSANSGCSLIRQRMARCSERCSQLCEQSRTARQQGWPEQANLLLNEALRQRPKDRETRRELVDAMWEAGRRDEAVMEMSKLTEEFPDDPALWTQYATQLWQLENRDGAGRAAGMALAHDPNATDALLISGRLLAANGQAESALTNYIRLSQLAPDRLDVRFELAELHARRGNVDQAGALLRDIAQHGQATAEHQARAEWELGLAYAAAGRWSDAASQLETAIERREATSADWQCVATVKSMAGLDSRGAEAMAKASSNTAQRPTKDQANGPNSETVWTELRNQLAQTTQLTSGTDSGTSRPRNSVVSADYNRVAEDVRR